MSDVTVSMKLSPKQAGALYMKSLKQADRIADLERQLAAAQPTAQQVEDARRFNLIEKTARRVQWTGCGFEWEFFTECSRDDETLSAAIDAALQAEKEKKHGN